MQGAKESKREQKRAKEGGRERVRKGEGKREQDGEWEKSSQFGEESSNGPSNRGMVGLTLKFYELLWPSMTFEVILI